MRGEGLKRRVQFTLIVLVLLLLLLVAVGIAAATQLHRASESRYVKQALPLRTATRDIVLQMVNEETGVRGYMITRRRASLAPYFAGRFGVANDLATLEKLSRRDPSLRRMLPVLRRQIRALHVWFARQIVFIADSPEGQRRAQRDLPFGAKRFVAFRLTAARMRAVVDRFVEQTRADQRRTFRGALAALIGAGGGALAIALVLLFRVPERLRILYARERDARLRAEEGANAARALAHINEAVVLIDDEGFVRSWNPAAEALFATTSAEAVGSAAVDVVPELDVLETTSEVPGSSAPVLVHGEVCWLSAIVTAFDGGRVLAVRDVSAEQELERLRTDFVATASHELRTPVTAVYGAAQTLRRHGDELSADRQRRLMQMIEEEAERLAQITDQMLVVAQADRGELRLEEAECDVVALCRTVIGQERFRLAGPFTMLLVAPTQMAPVRCDGGKLRQVVLNLVENAVKYSPEGGRVELRVEDGTELVRLQVTDTGLGIPPAEQERVFEKFYRVDAQMSRGIGGSGLGLYISRQIVEQMGGRLTVDSELGRGSTFTVELPR